MLMPRQLTITALNLSKTAYAAFALDAKSFFLDYDYNSSGSAKTGDTFTCQLFNKVRKLTMRFWGHAYDQRRLCNPYSGVELVTDVLETQ